MIYLPVQLYGSCLVLSGVILSLNTKCLIMLHAMLQDENENLRAKCSTLENKLEQNLKSLGQYGRKNNLVLSGVPENVPDN